MGSLKVIKFSCILRCFSLSVFFFNWLRETDGQTDRRDSRAVTEPLSSLSPAVLGRLWLEESGDHARVNRNPIRCARLGFRPLAHPLMIPEPARLWEQGLSDASQKAPSLLALHNTAHLVPLQGALSLKAPPDGVRVGIRASHSSPHKSTQKHRERCPSAQSNKTGHCLN